MFASNFSTLNCYKWRYLWQSQITNWGEVGASWIYAPICLLGLLLYEIWVDLSDVAVAKQDSQVPLGWVNPIKSHNIQHSIKPQMTNLNKSSQPPMKTFQSFFFGNICSDFLFLIVTDSYFHLWLLSVHAPGLEFRFVGKWVGK